MQAAHCGRSKRFNASPHVYPFLRSAARVLLAEPNKKPKDKETHWYSSLSRSASPGKGKVEKDGGWQWARREHKTTKLFIYMWMMFCCNNLFSWVLSHWTLTMTSLPPYSLHLAKDWTEQSLNKCLLNNELIREWHSWEHWEHNWCSWIFFNFYLKNFSLVVLFLSFGIHPPSFFCNKLLCYFFPKQSSY